MDQPQVANINFNCELINIPQPGAPISTLKPVWECANLKAINGFQIVAGGDVTFRAQSSIGLGAGFQVGSGGQFDAVIAP